MTGMATTLRAIGDAELNEVVELLKRSEQDVRGRIARHAAALDNACRARDGDPLYQRLSAVFDKLSEELVAAQDELRRRARVASA